MLGYPQRYSWSVPAAALANALAAARLIGLEARYADQCEPDVLLELCDLGDAMLGQPGTRGLAQRQLLAQFGVLRPVTETPGEGKPCGGN